MTFIAICVILKKTFCWIRRINMAISYKSLWHLLLEKEMNKEDLKRTANITNNIISRMNKNAYLNLDSIEKIYLALNCRIEDVVEILKEDN